MQCDRAQEFFSDYLEGTLERPMAVAVEAHLQACRACDGDVQVLRQTWRALNAVPMVEPPADFARRVAARVQQDRWERQATQRRRLAFWESWRQALTPAHAVGLAAAAALVAFALANPLRRPEPAVQWNPLNPAPPRPPAAAPQHPPAEADPTLAPQVGLGPVQFENDRWVGLAVVTPRRDLPQATVSATLLDLVGDHLRGMEPMDLAEGTMQAGRPYRLPIPLGTDAVGARAVLLRIASPALAQGFRKVIYFPIPDRAAARGPVSVELANTDVYVALARLSAAARLPLVADTDLAGQVSLRLQAAPPEHALGAILGPLGYRGHPMPGGYAVTRY